MVPSTGFTATEYSPVTTRLSFAGLPRNSRTSSDVGSVPSVSSIMSFSPYPCWNGSFSTASSPIAKRSSIDCAATLTIA